MGNPLPAVNRRGARFGEIRCSTPSSDLGSPVAVAEAGR